MKCLLTLLAQTANKATLSPRLAPQQQPLSPRNVTNPGPTSPRNATTGTGTRSSQPQSAQKKPGHGDEDGAWDTFFTTTGEQLLGTTPPSSTAAFQLVPFAL